MASREILVRLRADVGNFRSSMTQAATSARGAGDAAEEAGEQSQRGIRGLMANAEANSEAWGKVGGTMLVAGGAIAAGVGVSIAKFAEFDKAMSSVDAATHETAANMELLREAAIAAGADTAFSAAEAAQGIEEMAKAGVSTQEILGGGLTGALSLAAAGALGVGDAAEIASSAMTQFKLSGDKIPHLADLLAAGAGKAQGSVQDLGGALNQAGLVASQAGLSIEETVGGLAAFASAGMVGSDAGTSFKSMLQRLTPTSKESAKLMDELGISAYDAQGDFIGLEAFAGNLQESMADLTVEQRNASMATIFGSDAVRAASVMYEQGAEGVGTWIAAVDDAGYAAETAARMQDNLAGDIEKLGGAFDTLMIKSGTGPAEMLRGIVQAAESAIDAVGKVPTPVLASITVAAALVGGLLLLGGAFITIIPKIAATRAAMAGFNASSAGMVAGMKKIGIAGGIAAVAIVGLGIASAAASKKSTYDMESIEGSLIQLAKSGGTTKDVFNEDFFKAASDSSDPFSEKITSVGQALRDLGDIDFGESWNQGSADFLNGIFGGQMTTQAKETQKAIQGMSDGLATMVQNGDGEEAAAAFAKIAADGKLAGVEVATTAGHFGTYESALRKQANTLKVALTDEEYHQWMLGNTPPLIDAAAASAEGQTAAAEAMAAANEETAEALAEVGLAADGTIQSLGKLLEAMFAAGLASMSASEATGAFHETLRGLDVEIQKVIASQGAGNSVMNEAGSAFDATTASGYAAVGVFNDVAAKGQNMTQAMADNNATQGELQGALRTTYDSLVTTAIGLGAGEDAAHAMAREVLNIPDDANVDTAIQNYADTMAKLNGIDNTVKDLDGKTANLWVTTHEKSIYSSEHVSNGPGGSGGQTIGGWTGGMVGQLIDGLAGGGMVPGAAPLNSHGDNILATVNGKPFGLRSGEMVINETQTKRNMPLLKAINEGTYQAPSMSQSAYSGGAGGGSVAGATLSITIGDLFAADLPGLKREVIAEIDRKYRNAGVTA